MIAIIPARGGSKGLPRKNIKPLNGKPLIYYTIKAAKESKYIDRIILSTDDQEIADIGEMYGAEVPFLRPPHLATDAAKARDVYLFTLEMLNKDSEIHNEDFMVLQPTSPLRRAIDIDNAAEIFYQNNADSVISVVEAEHPPDWYKKINQHGLLIDFFLSNNNKLNRQEYERSYIPNGAIFIMKYNVLKEHTTYYTDRTYPYVMGREFSVDIDNRMDFMLAEILLKSNN
ncbi:N-acylneuraminate cytidylyltransferase/CMP-N,N'-diacetyllegionaminic acid synthase [Salirhabdus euzebyi]|uniref:N-acylneuraminate cytidylyltransferase/CMP-N,N'-diacetyllegionaminic acid synthase n=1 Tax=Salirhabdus euzebyi TaxID=394506 RepID=A0A841Q7X1_9BACI|nr:acylneuraminate cytidylyltransferase family protein [Salirhabdus euzebyi]MBB6454541.1 N-acylneuraminate cytidylyltransferase/CMP-N,N'-diacetyllegionaminic acid synthase [Salirhabdus euzebyi]